MANTIPTQPKRIWIYPIQQMVDFVAGKYLAKCMRCKEQCINKLWQQWHQVPKVYKLSGVELQNILQQPSMNKNKYVSSLDLKLLGAKFITIPDSHLEISSTFSTIRKSKNYQLPSILTTMPDQEHITPAAYLQAQQRIVLPTHKKNYKTGLPGLTRCRGDEAYSQQEKQEIAKYRQYISKLKQDNQLIHKQIKNLYREQRLNANQPKTKNIKNIMQASKEGVVRENRFRLSPEAKKYQHIYEDLHSQENPYRKQSLEIQKKFSSNNIHKSFENFLLSHNKRVPEFIKNIR